MATRSYTKYAYLPHFQDLSPLFDDADHIDIKTVESTHDLRTFVTRLLSYQPGWVTALYGVRWAFVRMLGMSQQGVPKPPQVQPEDLPMSSDESAEWLIFKVTKAKEEAYWFASAAESHLSATLGVIAEPINNGYRYHVVTLVHYRSWAGPVYFNTIRPFHHLVVGSMMKHASKPA